MRPLLLLACLALLTAADQPDQFADLKAKATKAQHDYVVAMLAVGEAAAAMRPKPTGDVATDSGSNVSLNTIAEQVKRLRPLIAQGREAEARDGLSEVLGLVLGLGSSRRFSGDGVPAVVPLNH